MNEEVAPHTVVEPRVGRAYSNGWRQLWKYFAELILVFIITYAFSVPVSIIATVLGYTNPAAGAVFTVFSTAYSILVLLPLGLGMYYISLKAARGEKVQIGEMFIGFRIYGRAILGMVLVTLIVMAGLFLLIVPGIIFACKLAFVPFLLTDKRMSATDAIAESWNMTRGHAGTIFLIGLLAIPIFLLGILAFGVGVIISELWVYATLASMYHAVDSRLAASRPPSPVS